MRAIGEDVSEVIDYVPGRFRVIRHVRPKLACVKCDCIAQVPAPSRPIERGLPGAGVARPCPGVQEGPLLESLREWLRETLGRTSKKSDLAAAISYVLMRWTALTRYRDDGRIEIDNNAAERALRTVALGRKNYLFCGSDAGGERAAAVYSLVGTAKLNGIDPERTCASSWSASLTTRSTASTSCCPGRSPRRSNPSFSSPPDSSRRRQDGARRTLTHYVAHRETRHLELLQGRVLDEDPASRPTGRRYRSFPGVRETRDRIRDVRMVWR